MSTTLPTISHPTNRPNFTEVTVPLAADGSRELTVWYSYSTPVGFLAPHTGQGIILRRNDWGPTTGRHLNEISRTAPRLDPDAFDAALSAALSTTTTTEEP